MFAVAKLQDAVPPFPTPLALEVLEEELGRPPSEVFSELSDEPIAAASLAQVSTHCEMCLGGDKTMIAAEENVADRVFRM